MLEKPSPRFFPSVLPLLQKYVILLTMQGSGSKIAAVMQYGKSINFCRKAVVVDRYLLLIRSEKSIAL